VKILYIFNDLNLFLLTCRYHGDSRH
jgi:hypothetical protein